MPGMHSGGLCVGRFEGVVGAVNALIRLFDGLVSMRRMSRRSVRREYKLGHHRHFNLAGAAQTGRSFSALVVIERFERSTQVAFDSPSLGRVFHCSFDARMIRDVSVL